MKQYHRDPLIVQDTEPSLTFLVGKTSYLNLSDLLFTPSEKRVSMFSSRNERWRMRKESDF